MATVLSQLTISDYLVGGFSLFVVVGFLGAIANAVLEDSGFGTALNGCLLLFGSVLGAYARGATIGFQ